MGRSRSLTKGSRSGCTRGILRARHLLRNQCGSSGGERRFATSKPCERTSLATNLGPRTGWRLTCLRRSNSSGLFREAAVLGESVDARTRLSPLHHSVSRHRRRSPHPTRASRRYSAALAIEECTGRTFSSALTKSRSTRTETSRRSRSKDRHFCEHGAIWRYMVRR